LKASFKRKIIWDLIVPRTRVCHAPTRVILCSTLLALLLCLPRAGLLSREPITGELDLHGPGIYVPADPAAMASFDFEGPVLYHEGKHTKDHSIVYTDGTFHLFYIIGNDRTIGYANSTDLRHWEISEEPVLEPGPETWDGVHVWAPCVVPLEYPENYYAMFYTGVNGHGAQRTGLAYSSGDFTRWIKATDQLLEPFACDTAWCLWDENSLSHFRDPFLFTDGESSYLLQTARTRDGFGVIALTSGDGWSQWADAGPLYVHNSWHLLESSMILKRDDLYHLFFTEETVGGTSHMSSDTLLGGWDIRFRSIIDGGHACEITRTSPDTEIFSRHTSYSALSEEMIYSIRFDTLTWSGDIPHPDIEPALGMDWTILWGDAFIHQPVFGDAYAFRGIDTVSVGFEGNWWIGTAEAFSGPVHGWLPGMMQGDGPRGAIRSRAFEVTGRSMRLLVGGGKYPDSCYVALCSSSSGRIIYKETGRGSEEMDERVWDLEPLSGREVYIEIVDDCSSPMGHINVDGIRETAKPPPANPGERIQGSAKIIPRDADLSSQRENPSGIEIVASPNPFNPSTTISFAGGAGKTYSVVIYSIDGRKVFSTTTRARQDGIVTVIWDGRSDRGFQAASGIYAAAVIDGGRIAGMTKLVMLR
jgi:hypothetical protein